MRHPCLVKRKNYYHIRYYPNGDSRSRTFTTGFRDKSKANAELYKFVNGDIKPDNQLKVVKMSDLTNINFSTNKKTSDGYRSVINSLVKHTLDKPVHTYTTLDIDNLIDKLHGTRSPYTIKSYIRVLSTIFSKAINYGYASSNPVPGHKKFILPPLELDFLTKDEFRKFISFVDSEVYRDLYKFAVLTGMRLNEIISCKSEHISDNFIYVPVTKTNTPRTVDLADTLKPIINKYNNQEYIFKNLKEKLQDRTVQKKTREWLLMAGLKDVSFHSFRKTYGKWLLDEGVSIEYISKQLGHTTIAVTMAHYARFLNNEFKGYVNRIAL